jgi:hypothetical protein
MSTGDSSGFSANGWPAHQDPDEIGIDEEFSVAGSLPSKDGGFSGGVKSGDVATVFGYLIGRLHEEVEPMQMRGWRLGYDCWGYLYRTVAGSPGLLSAHASGTAVDYNVWLHPDGTVAGESGSGWSSEQFEQIVEILKQVVVVSWWAATSPAHFEILGSADQVADAARRLVAMPIDPEVGGGETEEDDDMYATYQVDTGPESENVWIASPGVFEVIPDPEYYEVLVAQGAAKPVRVVPQRTFDVLRDSYRRWGASGE